MAWRDDDGEIKVDGVDVLGDRQPTRATIACLGGRYRVAEGPHNFTSGKASLSVWKSRCINNNNDNTR